MTKSGPRGYSNGLKTPLSQAIEQQPAQTREIGQGFGMGMLSRPKQTFPG